MKLRDVLNYLKEPVYIKPDNKTKIGDKIRDVLISTFFCVGFSIVSIFFLAIIDVLVIKTFFDFSFFGQLSIHNENISKKFGSYTFFVIIFAGPLIEEIVFRLPLKLQRFSIGLSLSIIAFRSLGGSMWSMDLNSSFTYYRFAIALAVFLLIVKFLPSGWMEVIKKKYFKYFFYLTTLYFGLGHISNYEPYNYDVFLFYPLFVLPQLIAGFFFAFIRMKHGFISGLAVHSLNNFLSSLPRLI